MAKDRKTEHRRKKEIKLTVDVCLPRVPLALVGLSVGCLSAWHRATPSLLYIQLLGAAHDKPYCIFISTSRSELSRIRGFLTTRHEHTLTFLITRSSTHTRALARTYVSSRVHRHLQVGKRGGGKKKKKKSKRATYAKDIYIYKIHVYIVATLHAQKSYRCGIISIHEEAINLYNLFITIIP